MKYSCLRKKKIIYLHFQVVLVHATYAADLNHVHGHNHHNGNERPSLRYQQPSQQFQFRNQISPQDFSTQNAQSTSLGDISSSNNVAHHQNENFIQESTLQDVQNTGTFFPVQEEETVTASAQANFLPSGEELEQALVQLSHEQASDEPHNAVHQLRQSFASGEFTSNSFETTYSPVTAQVEEVDVSQDNIPPSFFQPQVEPEPVQFEQTSNQNVPQSFFQPQVVPEPVSFEQDSSNQNIPPSFFQPQVEPEPIHSGQSAPSSFIQPQVEPQPTHFEQSQISSLQQENEQSLQETYVAPASNLNEVNHDFDLRTSVSQQNFNDEGTDVNFEQNLQESLNIPQTQQQQQQQQFVVTNFQQDFSQPQFVPAEIDASSNEQQFIPQPQLIQHSLENQQPHEQNLVEHGENIVSQDGQLAISTKPAARPHSQASSSQQLRPFERPTSTRARLPFTVRKSKRIDSSHCPNGHLADIYGNCVEPEVTRNVFLYAAPVVARPQRARIPAPKPKLEYNIVFVSNPADEEALEPVVIPPAQQKTLVYVLSKKGDAQSQGIIEAPYHPQPEPEVFFVNYGEGENPELPGGIDLNTALAEMVQEGRVIGNLGGVRSQQDVEINTDFGLENQGNFIFETLSDEINASHGSSENEKHNEYNNNYN